MKYGNRPNHFWYHPKPVNDIEKICDAVTEAVYDLDGRSWNSDKAQEAFQRAIVDADIFLSESAMAGRNWMSAMQHFGLVYARFVTPASKGRKKKITVTPIGKQLEGKNQSQIKEIIRYQLEKMQYPNATIKKLPKNMLQNPLYVVLKIIKSTKTLTIEEMGYFVMAVQNHSEIPATINTIKKYRKDRKIPFLPMKTKKILRDYAGRFLRHDFTWAGYLTESKLKRTYSYKINTEMEKEIDEFLSNEPILNRIWGITTGPDRKRNWNAWFEYYGSKKKAHRNVKKGVVTAEMWRAKKLIKIVDADEDDFTIEGKKIPLKKLERERFDFNSLMKIFQDTNVRNKYPKIGRMSIDGNNLVELPKHKKERIKLSDKVKRFEQTRVSAEFSDNSKQFERDVACVMAQFNVQSIWHGVKSSGKAIEDVEVLGDTKGKRFAILLDAKSREKTFSIDTNSRRAMRDYFDNHQSGKKKGKIMWRMSKSCKLQKIPLKSHYSFGCEALVFVSSSFSGIVKTGLGDLKKKTRCDCSCIRAEELLYLLDKHLNNPGKLTNDKLLKLFQRNGEILKAHINKLF